MMKRLFTLLLLFVGLSCNAQIYKSIMYYDKFDDVVKSEQRKTLITQTDSTFIIEEKGRTPIVYYILNTVGELSRGSKDETVNLVNNVYGYEEGWCVVRNDMMDKYRHMRHNYIQDHSNSNLEAIQSLCLFIVRRTVKDQFTGAFINEVLWIEDFLSDGKLGKNVNRIIYLDN